MLAGPLDTCRPPRAVKKEVPKIKVGVVHIVCFQSELFPRLLLVCFIYESLVQPVRVQPSAGLSFFLSFFSLFQFKLFQLFACYITGAFFKWVYSGNLGCFIFYCAIKKVLF